MFSKRHIWSLIILMGVGFFLHSFKGTLFNDGESKVVYDRDGQLLGASIASDGQWRFPERTDVPRKFALAVLQYEDSRYFFHRGIDPIAVARAIYLNTKHRSIISGASTITMQVSRMSRKNRPRTFFQKGIETAMALFLELNHSKREILSLYASNAPFGGNVVGLDAASWRYFNKRPEMLTWAESTTLAVLPNAPGLIHPGRNRSSLLQKRNELLQRLYYEGIIDSFTLELSLMEPIPKKPFPLPRKAPHLMDQLRTDGSQFKTTIDGMIQEEVVTISDDYYRQNVQKGIENHGILVVDNRTGEVVSYVGNSRGHHQENHVDMVQAKRSSGSILKPFLYASMMQAGKISPDQLLPDVPTSIKGFNPKNYNKSYAGAIKASTALARSLNVPAV
ncbi:MAG: penicillin-binding protein 1C, partial [Saprospiraceae bacterium]|nr:penicillin-binding protein 1C [Saprospiraceae bacterium]